MDLLLGCIIVLIPLAISPGSFFYFDVTPKVVLFLLGTSAAALWWITSTVAWTPARLYRASRPARWFLLVLCGMATSLVISTAASVNPALSSGGSNWRYWGLVTQLATVGFAYLVTAVCAGSTARLQVLLRGLTISGILVALYGIAQYFGWDPLLDPRSYHVGEGIWTIVRPPSTLGHADYSANWLLFVVFGSAALALSEVQVQWRWLAWSAVGLSSVAIVFSGTRAAMLGLVSGGLFLLASRGWRRLYAAGILAALTLGALFYVSPAGVQLRARVHWALTEPAGGARLLLWRDSLKMAAGRWLVGYGPDTFTGEFALHESAELARAYPDFYHESSHNMLLDALVSQGLAGPLLLAALAGSGFASARISGRDPLAGALAAGLVAMTVSEQFACFSLPTGLAYYVTVAMLVSRSVRVVAPQRAVINRWARGAVAAPYAAILLLFGVRLWVAEAHIADTSRDLDRGRVYEAAENYAAYERWRWPGASADLWYSRRLAQIAGSDAQLMVRMQALQQAGLAAERAPQTTEAPFNAYYNLAAYYARKNDFGRTEQSLRSAIDHAPNWFKTHWMLAQVLQAAARLDEAETESAIAATLDGGKHREVTDTLDRIRAARKVAMLEPPHK